MSLRAAAPPRPPPWFLLVLLLLVAPQQAGAQADAPPGGVDVRVDLYRAVDARNLVTEDPCGGSFRTDADGRGFLYQEADAVDAPLVPPGHGSSGCGQARLGLLLPPGAAALHVSFLADRRVETFLEGDDAGATEQGVRVRDLDSGRVLHQWEYFARDEHDREGALHGPEAVVLPDGTRNVTLEFYFLDVPPLDGQVPGSEPLSGRAFSSYVHDVAVEVRGAFAPPADVRRSEGREGTLLLEEVRVSLEVPEGPSGFAALPRVRAGPDLDFSFLRLPDGRTVDAAHSLNATALRGPPAVLASRSNDALEVLANPALARDGGPGPYVFVLRDVADVRVHPALLPLAGVLLGAPLPFATVAFLQARVFARDAFGAYRRAARNLMLGVVVVFVYYLAVVASALAAGRLDLMGVWPLPLEGVLLYVQAGAAVAAFAVLWLSARALFWITRPGEAQRAREDAGDMHPGYEDDMDW